MPPVDSNLRDTKEMYYSTHMAETKESHIVCTYCLKSPAPAAETCLHCEVSLCYEHLKVHPSSPEHILIKPSASIRDGKRSIDQNTWDRYTSEQTENVYVNYFPDNPAEHSVTSTSTYETQRGKLKNVLEGMTLKREDIDDHIFRLKEDVKEKQRKALQLAEKVTDLFRSIRWQLEEKEKGVLAKIFHAEDQFSKRVSEQIRQLEIKKIEVLGKIDLIKKLVDTVAPLTDETLNTDDFCDTEYSESSYLTIERWDSRPFFVGLPDEGSVFEILHSGLYDIATGASRMIPILEASDIFFDVRTAANIVALSEDLKNASLSAVPQNYPESPERFEDLQVLSFKSFSSGQHYWDVETSQQGNWMIGVAYATIDRNGDQLYLGENKKSWCLSRLKNTYSVIHARREEFIPQECACNIIRIYLDYDAGRLSFYELSDTVRHLYTYNTTFTQPLHAAVGLLQDIDWCWVRIKS